MNNPFNKAIIDLTDFHVQSQISYRSDFLEAAEQKQFGQLSIYISINNSIYIFAQYFYFWEPAKQKQFGQLSIAPALYWQFYIVSVSIWFIYGGIYCQYYPVVSK